MAYTIEKHLTTINKGAKGTNKPEWIIFHFVGANGQAKANANYFHSTYRGASAHYFVDPNNIVQVVEDDTPAWHIGDGSRTKAGKHNGYVHPGGATNTNSIGIENCQDTSTGHDVWTWNFAEETLKRTEWLIHKLQKKYNIDDDHVIRHYDASTKLCPGNWQANDWAQWKEFKKRLITGIKQPTPSGKPNDEGKKNEQGMYLIKPGDTLSAIAKKYGVTVKQLVAWNDLENPNLIIPETKLFVKKSAPSKPTTGAKSIDQLADEVIAGKHGSGAQRKKSLGSQYDAVQKRVNEKLLGTKSKPKPSEKSIDQLVKETLAGKHGNGEARKKSLGKNYQAVQDIINGKTSAPKKTTSKPKGDQKTNSIVDYLKSIKVDSSFANRKKLAAKHGIKNYSGTQSQNDQLLKKMRE